MLQNTRDIECTFQVAPNEYSLNWECGFCYSTTIDEPTYDAEGCEYVVANENMAKVSKDVTGLCTVHIRPYAIFKDKNSLQKVTVYGNVEDCAYEEE